MCGKGELGSALRRFCLHPEIYQDRVCIIGADLSGIAACDNNYPALPLYLLT